MLISLDLPETLIAAIDAKLVKRKKLPPWPFQTRTVVVQHLTNAERKKLEDWKKAKTEEEKRSGPRSRSGLVTKLLSEILLLR